MDQHSHGCDTLAVRRGLLLKRMHENIVENPTQPVRRIYDQVVVNDSGDSDDVASFSGVRTRTKLFRSQLVPPIPSTIYDVDITGQWTKTWKGKTFLRFLDNNCGVAIFTTKRFLKALQETDCMYLDGTFRTSPHPYNQFVTIHGNIGGFIVPLVFILMTGKTTAQYTAVLQHLKQEVQTVTNRALGPRRVITDFEHSLKLAVETEFPNSRWSGCYFHFTQSLWIHVQQVGLAAHYRNDRKLRKMVRKIMAIGFLPTLLVRHNFALMRNSRRTQRLVNRFPSLDDWLDYVERTYVSQNAVFPPAKWNVFDRKCKTRTNNHIEGNGTSTWNNCVTFFVKIYSNSLTCYNMF